MPKNNGIPQRKKPGLIVKILLAVLLVIVILIAFIDLFAGAILAAGYYMNWTDSMPIGFYKVSPITKSLMRGDAVLVCLPLPIGLVGLHHEYLLPGKCPGGFEPIIKEVIALPHDTVTLTNEAMIVNGTPYPAHTRTFDHLDRPLTAIPRGNYSNTPDYWLYGQNNPGDSWDSRYWGGVGLQNITLLAHPVLTMH